MELNYSTILLLLASVFFNCFCITKCSAQSDYTIDHFPAVKEALNKKQPASNNSYYEVTESTDSTVHLLWGNDTLQRMFNDDIHFYAAERIEEEWHNRDYCILRYGTGSEAWEELVLPMNNKEPTREYSNALYFDSVNNLLCYQGDGDTILSVVNLKTKQEQYIIDTVHPCYTGDNRTCTGGVFIKNKILNYYWEIAKDENGEKTKWYKRKVQLRL